MITILFDEILDMGGKIVITKHMYNYEVGGQPKIFPQSLKLLLINFAKSSLLTYLY